MTDFRVVFNKSLNIINKIGKWEDYVEQQLEDTDNDIDTIYTEFSWGHFNCTYGQWLMNCVNEVDDDDESDDEEDDEED